MSREEWDEYLGGSYPPDVSDLEVESHAGSCLRCANLRQAIEREQQVLHQVAANVYRQHHSDPTVRRISAAATTHAMQSLSEGGAEAATAAYKEGDRIDDYVVLKALPPGGFGRPYLVYPQGGNQLTGRVVLKLLCAGTLQAELEDRGIYSVYSVLQRAVLSGGQGRRSGEGRRKRQVTAAVPLLPCFGAGKTGRDIYVLTEYCPGGSLKDLLDQKTGGIPLEAACRYVRDVLRATQMLHEHGLSHNDIKPGNVFLRDAGVVLGDYSLVSRIENIPHYGTPGYIAPERLAGNADHRADLYSLGMTFFELITGLPPEYHLDLPVDLDMPVRSMIERAKKYDPGQRYPTAAAMLEELDRYGVERKWWPPEGVSREEARRLENAFVDAMVSRFSTEAILGGGTWKPRGSPLEGNQIDQVLALAEELRVRDAAEQMPLNRSVMRTYQQGWWGERRILVGACLSPLRELLRDGGSTKTMSHDDLSATAGRIAKDEHARYLIGLFAPCGWSADCSPAEGPNWHAFPIDKLEGTRWHVDLGAADPRLLTVFDPESRDQKLHRLQAYIRSRPELHRPDGVLTLEEIRKAQEIGEVELVEEAMRLTCRQDSGLVIMDFPGFGQAIARRGLGI